MVETGPRPSASLARTRPQRDQGSSCIKEGLLVLKVKRLREPEKVAIEAEGPIEIGDP